MKNNKGSVKVVLAIMIPVLILLLGAICVLYYLKTEKDRAAEAVKNVEDLGEDFVKALKKHDADKMWEFFPDKKSAKKEFKDVFTDENMEVLEDADVSIKKIEVSDVTELDKKTVQAIASDIYGDVKLKSAYSATVSFVGKFETWVDEYSYDVSETEITCGEIDGEWYVIDFDSDELFTDMVEYVSKKWEDDNEYIIEDYVEEATEDYWDDEEYEEDYDDDEYYGDADGDGVIRVWSFTDEVTSMVEKYKELHPDFPYEIEATIISTADGGYEPALDSALAAGGSDAPDIFAVEAAFAYKYTKGDMSSYACPYEDLGIDVNAKIGEAQIAQYTIDIGSNNSGEVVGLSYQSCGNMFIYRRSIAMDVFGTDDPDAIAEEIGSGSGNWDKFFAAAGTVSSNGYAMLSGTGDLWDGMSTASAFGWDDNGSLYIDPKRESFLDYCKMLYDGDYTNGTSNWTDPWYEGMSGSGSRQVFGYIGPAWMIDYVMLGNSGGESVGEGTYGDWAVCAPPEGSYWGGTWVLANKDSEKKEAIGEILEWITLDCSTDGLQYMWATNEFWGYDTEIKDTVPSATVMDLVDGSLDFLGGQNMYEVAIEANNLASGKSISEYDDALSYEWQSVCDSYGGGYITRDEAISEFKQFAYDNTDLY